MNDEERGTYFKEPLGFFGMLQSFYNRVTSYVINIFKPASLEAKSRKAKYVKIGLKRNIDLLDDAIAANDRYIQELQQRIIERARENQMIMAVQLFKERKMREVSSASMAEGRTAMIRIELDLSRAILAESMAESIDEYKNFSGIIDPKKIEERAKSLQEIQESQDEIWVSVQKEIAKIGSGNLILPEVKEDDEHILKSIKEMMNVHSGKEEDLETTLRERSVSRTVKRDPEEEISIPTLLDDE